jgi:hypothetical protein
MSNKALTIASVSRIGFLDMPVEFHLTEYLGPGRADRLAALPLPRADGEGAEAALPRRVLGPAWPEPRGPQRLSPVPSHSLVSFLQHIAA